LRHKHGDHLYFDAN